MAPQTTEFGTKVALLGGLAVVCAGRPIARPALHARRSSPIGRRSMVLRAAVVRCAASVAARRRRSSPPARPARGTVDPAAAEVLGRVPHDVDPATFPSITVDQDVARLEPRDHRSGRAGDRADARREPPARERRRCGAPTPRSSKPSTTATASTRCSARLERRRGERARPSSSATRSTTSTSRCSSPFGKQDGLSLGLESRGTVTDGDLRRRRAPAASATSSPFAKTFVMRRATGGRWLNVAVLPISASDAS